MQKKKTPIIDIININECMGVDMRHDKSYTPRTRRAAPGPEEKSIKQIKPIAITPIMRAVGKAHAKPNTNVLHCIRAHIVTSIAPLCGEMVEEV